MEKVSELQEAKRAAEARMQDTAEEKEAFLAELRRSHPALHAAFFGTRGKGMPKKPKSAAAPARRAPIKQPMPTRELLKVEDKRSAEAENAAASTPSDATPSLASSGRGGVESAREALEGARAMLMAADEGLASFSAQHASSAALSAVSAPSVTALSASATSDSAVGRVVSLDGGDTGKSSSDFEIVNEHREASKGESTQEMGEVVQLQTPPNLFRTERGDTDSRAQPSEGGNGGWDPPMDVGLSPSLREPLAPIPESPSPRGLARELPTGPNVLPMGPRALPPRSLSSGGQSWPSDETPSDEEPQPQSLRSKWNQIKDEFGIR
jgi:hypothetical protein